MLRVIRLAPLSFIAIALALFGFAATAGAQNACTPAATPSPAADASTPAAQPAGARVQVGDGEALLWGAGEHAVLLVHGAVYDAESWRPQAEAITSEGYLVLSLEQTGSQDVLDGITFLIDACDASGVVVAGASAGASGALSALASQPEGVSGLVVLAATGDVADLGDYPKLFAASEEEGLAETLEEMAASAPGDDNKVLILPGSAHAQAVFTTDQGPVLLEAMLAFIERTSTAA